MSRSRSRIFLCSEPNPKPFKKRKILEYLNNNFKVSEHSRRSWKLEETRALWYFRSFANTKVIFRYFYAILALFVHKISILVVVWFLVLFRSGFGSKSASAEQVIRNWNISRLENILKWPTLQRVVLLLQLEFPFWWFPSRIHFQFNEQKNPSDNLFDLHSNFPTFIP